MGSRPNYVIWRLKNVPGACVLDELRGVEKDYELLNGIPQAGKFPDDALFTMDPEFPRNTLLVDSLNNTDSLIVASPRLKELLEKRALKDVEYLTVKIQDHKRKIAAEYFIIHPLFPVDCLDLNRSVVRWGRIDKNKIDRVTSMVLDEAKIDPARELIRIDRLWGVVLAHRRLQEAIDKEGFTGVGWMEVDKYRGR